MRILPAAFLTLAFTCSMAHADSAWLAPPPPGAAYPAGEETRQWEMLQYDLGRRAAIERHAGQTFRPESLVLKTDRDPLDLVLRRTASLLELIEKLPGAPGLGAQAEELTALRTASQQVAVTDTPARQALFERAVRLRRRITLANPLLDFQAILFIKRQRSSYNHMCDQFYGISQRPGGGLFVLSDPFGPRPALRDVLAGSRVQNGRLKGQTLDGGPRRQWKVAQNSDAVLRGEPTEGGSFLSPALKFDGRTIAFAYAECQGERTHDYHQDPSRGHWASGRCFHVFRVGLDGSGLTMLTDGAWNDFSPCFMPSGRIALISERRGGYLRCGRVCPTYTLFDMAAGGSDLRCLSPHDVNEWAPSVNHEGMLVWTRWDYIDRPSMIAHHPWTTFPDGRNPRAMHGNYSLRNQRADMETDVRAIPNSPRYIATAAPHHGQSFGSLVVLDPRVADDDAMAPTKRLTPEVEFPESQGPSLESFGTAWPLNEDFYLCAYDPVQVPVLNPEGDGQPGDPLAGESRDVSKPFHRKYNPLGRYGLYLIDSLGNRELIYRDPDIGCVSPIPVRAQTPPPVIPEDRSPAAPNAPATVAVMDVTRGLLPWPAGTKITSLRIWQVIPLSVPSARITHTVGHQYPDSIAIAVGRSLLGTVPVETDGSAHFQVPPGKELFFQALNADGCAVQSMRSGTHFQPGEVTSCLGCHEPKTASAQMPRTAMALRRAPSIPKPGPDGTSPLSYPRLVQPVFEKYCIGCHEKNVGKAPRLDATVLTHVNQGPQAPPTRFYASYISLKPYCFYDYNAESMKPGVKRNLYSDPRSYRTFPGEFGALESKLYPMLARGHHDVKLAPEDLERIILWLDSTSQFYGVFEKERCEAQLRREIVHPTLE